MEVKAVASPAAAAVAGCAETQPAKRGSSSATTADMKMPAKKLKSKADTNVTLDRFSDEIIVNIASYGAEAIDMLRLALTCKRFGMKIDGSDHSLVEEVARRTLIRELPTAGYRIICAAARDLDWLKERVEIKSDESTYNDEGDSWMCLYYEWELCLQCWPDYLVLHKFIGSDDKFEGQMQDIQDPDRAVTKLVISGPEFDPEFYENDFYDDEGGYYHPRPEYLSEERIRKVFEAATKQPRLQEVYIKPGDSGVDREPELETSRVCMLLSPYCKFRTLRISNLLISNQTELEALASAFRPCKSIENLCIMPIYVGRIASRQLISAAPLMHAIKELPKLKRLRLLFSQHQREHVDESFQILQGIRGIVCVPYGNLGAREIRNCADMYAEAY